MKIIEFSSHHNRQKQFLVYVPETWWLEKDEKCNFENFLKMFKNNDCFYHRLEFQQNGLGK